jgi:hypothetical protein
LAQYQGFFCQIEEIFPDMLGRKPDAPPVARIATGRQMAESAQDSSKGPTTEEVAG